MVVVSPLLPLNRNFGEDEDRFEDHLASLKDRLGYSFESGEQTEPYRPKDDSRDETRIVQQPEQQAESGGISRISDVVGTVVNPNLCFGDYGGANTASARKATHDIQYVSNADSFEIAEATKPEAVDASQVKCVHRINQDAAR